MPVQLSVRLEGDDQVRSGLNKWATTIQPVTREIIQDHMKLALKRSIPWHGGNSYDVVERGYIRTGNLGRSAYVEQEGLTTRIKVEAYNYNGKEYSRYVVGGADGTGQAAVHRGYWVTMREAVDQELEDLTTDIDAKLGESAEAIGL